MARPGEKFCASKQADNHGDGQAFEEARAEDHVAGEGSAQSHAQVCAPTHSCALGEGHKDGVVPGKEGEGHVSETELLIAHVLAAMKDCSLFGKEDKSSSSARMSKVSPTQASSQASAEFQTSSRAWPSSAVSQTKVATRTSSLQAHSATSSSSSSSSSSSASTSSRVTGAGSTSSQAETTTQTSSQAHMATQTLSQACMAARSSSQENKAALCIASLKHAHNKENYKPSNRTLDMQDERAQPKFRNIADLYKLSEH